MCELFGFTAASSVELTPALKQFFSHSTQHPDGWGLAIFDRAQINIEKEPVPAYESVYLSHRLSVPIRERLLLAHIRKASVGSIQYLNAHPFTGTDAFGSHWVLIHNGTLFSEPDADVYSHKQKGSTDSERVLIRFLDFISVRKEAPGLDDCMDILEMLMKQLCVCNNKINMMLSDGARLYVYANHSEKLWMLQETDQITFSTQPLSENGWVRVPECRVLACQDGQLIRTGNRIGEPYIPPETA